MTARKNILKGNSEYIYRAASNATAADDDLSVNCGSPWRGDEYEKFLREAAAKYDEKLQAAPDGATIWKVMQGGPESWRDAIAIHHGRGLHWKREHAIQFCVRYYETKENQ